MTLFVQDSMCILILTIVGCFYSEHPYMVICVAGILLCLVCDRSFKDKENTIENLAITLISLSMALVSNHYFAYLVLGQCRLFKREYINLLLPASAYMTIAILYDKDNLPRITLHTLVLITLSIVICMIKILTKKYTIAKNQVSTAVTVTAVNEMYAKKLNQELVMKNYLADRNARLEERENISRNIHNSVGHSITAAIMTLDAADMLFDTSPDMARDKMNIANERIRTSLTSIRHAVRVLDSDSGYITMEDFILELENVINSFVMDTMIKVYTDFEDVCSDMIIPHEHTEFLTGAVQELMTNGVRHGKANVFTVTVISDSGNLKIKVVDNGKSDFSQENEKERIESGFGLRKMIAYVKKSGGNIAFCNENGFKSEINLKIYREDDNE